ncbi:hypothetical protein V8F06_008444 [Rhypophila decipiens]
MHARGPSFLPDVGNGPRLACLLSFQVLSTACCSMKKLNAAGGEERVTSDDALCTSDPDKQKPSPQVANGTLDRQKTRWLARHQLGLSSAAPTVYNTSDIIIPHGRLNRQVKVPHETQAAPQPPFQRTNSLAQTPEETGSDKSASLPDPRRLGKRSVYPDNLAKECRSQRCLNMNLEKRRWEKGK